MKKLLSALLCSSILMLAGCGGSAADSVGASTAAGSTPATSGVAASGELIKIGVIQLAPHPALDAAYDGFVDSLAEAGYVDGDNIVIDLQNAQGEIANCPTIASKLVNDGNDLILAIATPAAQAVANETKDIPIVATAVTDFVEAKLVNSNEEPGTNVTGTSDLTPVREQLELLTQLAPEAKNIGFLYCSSEANSIVQIDIAKEAAEELGLSYEEFTISNTNELQSVATSMVGKVDAIYTPTDNMIANAVSTVATIARDNQLPFVVGEEALVAGGGLASVSVNYYDLGRMTGAQAVQIIEGTSAPASMPIQFQSSEDVETVINGETAEALGIEVPQGVTVL
ncbi:ABC transporter substrate-binding protein [Ruminococcaceae bacterium OttesenSCG-928-I18]|nr:ABC transporter substrate-binding protein [Ruminococcaceae bacterium OttesenSCG-928-I18]